MRLLFLVIIVSTTSLGFCQQHLDAAEIVVPYSIKNDLIVIPVKVNGSIFKMILDSGSPVNFFFKKKHLSTIPQKRMKVKGLNDEVMDVEISLHNTLQIEHSSIHDFVFLVNTSDLNDAFEVDGIIGYTLFQHFEVEINPLLQQVKLRQISRSCRLSSHAFNYQGIEGVCVNDSETISS
jgi:hypothetical protein